MTTPPTDKQLAEKIINHHEDNATITNWDGYTDEYQNEIINIITAHLAPTREALKTAEEALELSEPRHGHSSHTFQELVTIRRAALTQIRALNPKTP